MHRSARRRLSRAWFGSRGAPPAQQHHPTGEGRTYVFANFEGTVIKTAYHAIRLRSDVNEWLDEKGGRTTKYASRPGLYCGLALLYNIQTGELDGILNDGYLQLMRVAATSRFWGTCHVHHFVSCSAS